MEVSEVTKGRRATAFCKDHCVLQGSWKWLRCGVNDATGACVYVEARGPIAHLGLVSVDPGQQRASLGSQLMAAAEADCRAAGYREMELRFINHRDDLHRFYLRLGFHDTVCRSFPTWRA